MLCHTPPFTLSVVFIPVYCRVPWGDNHILQIIMHGDIVSRHVKNHQAYIVLTHWGRDKVAAILQTNMFKRIFLNENICISNEISLKYIPFVFIDNKSTLVQMMTWRHPGDKPLCKLMLWTNADPVYWRIYVALGGDESPHCSIVMWYMSSEICVNTGSGNSLLLGSTKPLPGPVLTYF